MTNSGNLYLFTLLNIIAAYVAHPLPINIFFAFCALIFLCKLCVELPKDSRKGG